MRQNKVMEETHKASNIPLSGYNVRPMLLHQLQLPSNSALPSPLVRCAEILRELPSLSENTQSREHHTFVDPPQITQPTPKSCSSFSLTLSFSLGFGAWYTQLVPRQVCSGWSLAEGHKFHSANFQFLSPLRIHLPMFTF